MIDSIITWWKLRKARNMLFFMFDEIQSRQLALIRILWDKEVITAGEVTELAMITSSDKFIQWDSKRATRYDIPTPAEEGENIVESDYA